MSDTKNWSVEEAMFLADEWQERLVGKAAPRDFFSLLHSLANYLRVGGQAQRSLEFLQSEPFVGVERYLGYRLDHAQLLVLAMFETGQKEEAQRIIDYYVERPYLFEDMGRFGFFLSYKSVQSLKEHDGSSLTHCVKLLSRTQAGMRDAYLLRIIQQAGGVRKLFAAADGLDFSTRFLASVFWGAQRLSGRGVAAGVFGRGLHFGLNMLRTVSRLKGGNQAWMLRLHTPESTPAAQSKEDTKPIAVTRAMGGIGDILMMTPGLKALRQKHPNREIHFTIPKAFHSLLAHNKDVVLKDVSGEILRREDYFALYNLTECPASRVESATLPNVRNNRIDIFSTAMGINRKLRKSMGDNPVYVVTEEEKAWAKSFFAERGLVPEHCIAVQPYAADSYKDYPHMEALVARLAENSPVLVFHGAPLQGFDHPKVLKIDSCPMRQSIALLSMCKMLVAVDSSFVHIAAAFGKRTVALFGPTDGAVFTKYYPNCTVVDGYAQVNCAACWRNQGMVCRNSGTVESLCLRSIPVENILEKTRV